MITASSLSRLLNCPGSAVLPRAENASVWADAGTSEHADLAEQLSTGDLPDYIARVVPAGSRSEVALAFDVSTGIGRVLGENLGRSYGELAPFEICGSCDVVGVDGNAVVVVDYKTGFVDVEPAATNPQLAFYALAAARALGKQRAIVRIVYTKRQWINEAELDALDMAAFGNQLKSLHRRVALSQATKFEGTPVSTREGSWCRHCASRPYCGSKNALLVQIATQGLAAIGDSVMTPDRAAAAYEQLVRIEQLVKDAKARLHTFVVEQGPINLGNGKAYGRYQREGNKALDGVLAVRAIREVVGESAKEFEAMAIEQSTSQAALERAAKRFAPPRGAQKLKKAILDRIEELGGVSRRGDSFPIGEFVIGKDLSAPQNDVDYSALNQLLSLTEGAA